MKLSDGDVIELGEKHTVYADIPKHFVYENRKGDWSITKSAVNLSGEFKYLQGKYIVIKTEMRGGSSTGHGLNDSYPDGYNVTCEGVETGVIVNFYQSGCFTAMIKDIEPIGKARLEWKLSK